MPQLRDLLAVSDEKFKALYLNVFKWNLEDGKKSIQPELAVANWQMLLPPHFPKLEQWIEFIQHRMEIDDRKLKIHHISKDQWNQLFDFAVATQEDDFLESYDPNECAWPVLIDDFVENLRSNSTKAGT